MDHSIRRLTPREEARAVEEQLREQLPEVFKGNPLTFDVYAIAKKAKTLSLKKDAKKCDSSL